MSASKVGQAVVAVLLAAGAATASASVIYDNTTTPMNAITVGGGQIQIGDEINPAGTDRLVTGLLIGVTQQGYAGTADLRARLYANDGLGGAPSSLLWESPLMDNVPLSGNVDLIPFTVPMVSVPDPFTWTIEISDARPFDVGLPFFGPPTIGSSPDFAWVDPLAHWIQVGPNPAFPPFDYMARVIAVATPEPSTLLVLGSGLAGMAAITWGRSRRNSSPGR